MYFNLPRKVFWDVVIILTLSYVYIAFFEAFNNYVDNKFLCYEATI